jgi:CHRD domain-containing protein
MSKRLTRVIVALMLVSLTVGVAIAGAQGRSNEFTASMAGSKETPKGPSAAKGTFKVEFRNGQACYTMSVRALGAKPIAAHIHKAAAGKNGPIVIDLKPTFKGTSPRVSKKCVTAKASVVSAIRRNPSGYYANVHTPKNPGGAARGQLSAEDSGDDNGNDG